MNWNKRKFWTFVLAVIVGLVSGALTSELLRMILPTGVVRDFLTNSLNFGMPNIKLNIGIIHLSFGITFNITVFSVLFIIAVVYYFKWWL